MAEVVAATAVASAVYGGIRSEKAAKKNRAEYRTQRAENALQAEQFSNEQTKADAALKQSKKKLAVGFGRSFAQRSAGAAFKEGQQSANPQSGQTLG